MISLCNQWEFTKQWHDAFLLGEGTAENVRLPHTVQELPLHYADHNSYQMVCGYRKKLEITEEMMGTRLFLQLDGAAFVVAVETVIQHIDDLVAVDLQQLFADLDAIFVRRTAAVDGSDNSTHRENLAQMGILIHSK